MVAPILTYSLAVVSRGRWVVVSLGRAVLTENEEVCTVGDHRATLRMTPRRLECRTAEADKIFRPLLIEGNPLGCIGKDFDFAAFVTFVLSH